MFLKSIKYIYKNKPTDHIATSLVRELPIYLTGNLVHTSENELIDGALISLAFALPVGALY